MVAPADDTVKIEREQLTKVGHERYVAEASELGLTPGQVPETITTEMGNGLDLHLRKRVEGGFEYSQEHGLVKVKIYND